MSTTDATTATQDTFDVRRRVGIAAALGVAATAVAVAYLVRVVGGGSSWLDWTFLVVMVGLALAYLSAVLDARAPLLVVDRHGVRVRQGHTWSGVAWPQVEVVEHLPRRGLLRDGWILVARTDDDDDLTVPLSLSTRVVGLDGRDLSEMLDDLCGGTTEVVEIDPTVGSGGEWWEDEAPAKEAPSLPAMVASPTPTPLRNPRNAIRADLERDVTAGANALKLDLADHETSTVPLPEAVSLRRDGRPDLDGEATVVWAEGVTPIASPGDPVESLVIDDFVVEPAADPVIGPELSAARNRLGLSVDQLAERTRIRPHVIESIEVDDFVPCGGDFYARGHLRTLARVLALDVAPLLASYDDKYADAPIDPRRVFEAELATAGGSIRGTRGGPNWSVLVAAVMAVILVWSIVRLVMDSSDPVTPPNPFSDGSGGPNGNAGAAGADPVPVVLTAAGGGARVVVRDAEGEIVYDGQLSFGQSVTLEAAPPVRISTTDGSLEVNFDNEQRGPLGATGQQGQNTYVVR
ncbi:MAG: helix-turn-helix domain-containing protein [Actinomycetota bacterium]|nr:helix-turn-helix domain-containing protein [Actinomycetota bacterium]